MPAVEDRLLLIGRREVALRHVVLQRRHAVVQFEIEDEHLVVEPAEAALRQFLGDGIESGAQLDDRRTGP